MREVFGPPARGPLLVRALVRFASFCLASLEARCELEGRRKFVMMGGLDSGL